LQLLTDGFDYVGDDKNILVPHTHKALSSKVFDDLLKQLDDRLRLSHVSCYRYRWCHRVTYGMLNLLADGLDMSHGYCPTIPSMTGYKRHVKT
jgi:hypothetical protein